MKIRVLTYIFVLLSCNFSSAEKIKMYAFYTPSHETLLNDWFLPSLKKTDDVEVILECCKQNCQSGVYMNTGWTRTMRKKVELIIRAIKENWGGVFIYSDVDIQFFAPMLDIMLNLIQDKDLIIQKNSPEGDVCAGFFMCRANEKMLKLWEKIGVYMDNHPTISDQPSLNKFIRTSNPLGIKWGLLPATFYSGGVFTGKIWKPGETLSIPNGIVLHHANWTKGVESKIAQFAYVLDIVENR